MTIVSVTCFLLLLFIIVSCFRRGADVLSPARVFGFVWALSFGLADLKFSMFQSEWSLYGWAVLLLGVLGFLAGIYVAYARYADTPLLRISDVRSQLQESVRASIDPDKFFWVLTGLFVVYLVAYSIEVAVMGNVPMFSSNPERLRVTFGVFGVHLFVTAMLSIMIFAVEYMLFLPRRGGRTIGALVILLATAGTFFLLLQRYSFTFWALVTLALTYYGSRKIRLRTLALAAAAFIGVLVLIQNVRTAIYVEHYLYVMSRMKFPREYAALTEPYMYFVMNLENVARGVEKLDHYYYGLFTFDWVVALSGLKHWLDEYFAVVRLPFLNSGYNTYAFQWWAYYDFGPVGVGAIGLLFGLVTGFSYYRLRTRPTIGGVSMYAIWFVFMMTSFRENLFTRLDVVSNLFLIWLVHRYLARKSGSTPATVRAAT